MGYFRSGAHLYRALRLLPTHGPFAWCPPSTRAGTVFTALGGGSVAPSAVASAPAATHHPAAFAAVFVPAAVLALAGAVVATRLRPKAPPGPLNPADLR